MKNPQVTYTATFSNDYTFSKKSRSVRGFGYALLVIIDNDESICGVAFSSTEAGCMRSLKEFQAGDNVTRWEIVKTEVEA